MSSSRLLGIALLAVLSRSAFAGPQIVCPQHYVENGKTARLETAELFDGPPVQLVRLMPDLETWEWELSLLQKQAAERGESLYFVCFYKGTKATVELKIPAAATYCKVNNIKNGNYAACR